VDVSGGTNTVRIPDVLGDEQTAATKLLSAAPLNLLVTVVLETNEAIEAGRVVRSEPLGDTAVAPGSAITLYVSSGKATVTVPSVIGQTTAAASTQLTALGLTVTLVEQDVAAEDPSIGTVIAQNVAAGTNVQPGSALTLTVARAAVTP
jgi:serine/threonine-protein kinase